MRQILSYLQAASAIAFLVLGLVTAVGWLRRRDRSLGFLALAIVLLALVVLLTRVPELALLAFMGSGYSLLRFRASLIPLSPRWHATAVVAMVVTVGGFVATRILVSIGAVPTAFETVAALLVILVWSASVVEPIVRFWLVARDLPAVQAWRLRSLSLGFASLVVLIVFAVGAGAFASNPAVQLLIQLIVLAIVPLLYVSFSPPAWVRRQWRTREEQGLSQLMQDLLVLRVSRDSLVDRSLDVVTRLVGASAAVAIDPRGTPVVSRGLDPAALSALGEQLAPLHSGHSTIRVKGIQRATLTFPISLGVGSADRLVLIAGAFTPDLGSDEENRAYQFVTALATSFDRLDLIDRLETSNAQLLEANRHKSTFLANMSHELRTPLNAILGFSELLSDDTTGKYNQSTRRRFLDQIHTSGQHLLQLINDILDLSKVEAGQMDLHLQQVAVADSIDGVLATVEPLARLKEITLDSQPDPDLNLVADAAKLKQMLLNLVSNAIKFNPVGGRVTIRARQTESWIEIAVSDTGIGIAKADLGRLFTEFQQLDSGPGRQQEGTGLGLALTKRFAELHGGKVSVESMPGKGSTFTLRLPVEAKPTKEPSIPQPQPIESGDPSRPLILVVEDNPEAAELLARHLDAGGFRMEIARTGADALTMARALKPVAITLDILLPEIDGWEVLTRLKDDELTQNIPIVVVSVVDNPALGRALGALDYFVKPVDGKALLSRLAQYTFTTKVKTDQVRILVVDDEPANLDLLEALLIPAGFSVLKASGGQEGIDLARSQLPNLILLDLMMPRVTGFEVVEALRSEEPTRSIPIMVLTAKVLTEDDKRALNGHVAAIFQRNSVAGTELVDWIRKLIAKRLKS